MSATVKLPGGWSWATVAEVASVDIGFAFKSADYAKAGIRLLRGENIQPGSLRWLDTKYWPESKIDKIRHIAVDCGDVILAMDRPVVSAGLKIARVNASDIPCLLVQRVARLQGLITSNDYLYYALSSPEFVKHILIGGQTGTQLPHVSGSRIENFSFPLPPRREQQRIVDSLDSYLTRLDAAAEGLKRVEANLKRYRASVLKAAVEGRLVPTEAELARKEGREYEPASVLLDHVRKERRRRWEEAELQKIKAKGRNVQNASWKEKYEEPSAPDTNNLPALQEGWCWVSWSQVGFSQNGRPFPSSEYQSDGIKLLRPGNLHVSGRVEWNDSNTKRLPESWLQKHPDCLIGPCELVMNLTAQSLKDEFLGRICMTGSNEACLLNQRIARLTPILADRRYMLWLFKSEIFRKFVARLNTGSLIQHMFTSQLEEFVFPLPPLAEQYRIVQAIEQALSVEDHVLASLHAGAERLGKLRQSILKWAFEGKLVDQDPSDEPASVLLERIRKEREAKSETSPKRGRPRKAAEKSV